MAEYILNARIRRMILEFIIDDLRITEMDNMLRDSWFKIKDVVIGAVDKKYPQSDMKILAKYIRMREFGRIKVEYSDGVSIRHIIFPFNDPLIIPDKTISPLNFIYIDKSHLDHRPKTHIPKCPVLQEYSLKNTFDCVVKPAAITRLLMDPNIDTPIVRCDGVYDFCDSLKIAITDYYNLFHSYFEVVWDCKKFSQVEEIYPNVKFVKDHIYTLVKNPPDVNAARKAISQYQKDEQIGAE